MAAGKYYIHGSSKPGAEGDFFDKYGFAVESGSDDFLRYPKRKEPEKHDWEEEDGEEYDLDEPKFSSKEATLKGRLFANSESDFWNKYNLLFDKLISASYFTIYINELNKHYDVFYKECSNISRLTSILNTSDIKVDFELKLQILRLNDEI